MLGTIVKIQNELKVRIAEPMYGLLYLDPDDESRKLIDARNICDQVDGYVVRLKKTTEAGINVSAWQFHIESFEE